MEPMGVALHEPISSTHCREESVCPCYVVASGDQVLRQRPAQVTVNASDKDPHQTSVLGRDPPVSVAKPTFGPFHFGVESPHVELRAAHDHPDQKQAKSGQPPKHVSHNARWVFTAYVKDARSTLKL